MAHGRKYRLSRVVPKVGRPPGATQGLSPEGTFSIGEALAWITLAILVAFSLAILRLPLVRAFYGFEISYNEGWNVYNSQAAMQHLPLYSPKYGWTTVNYPFLSFYLIGYLSRLTGDCLLTGRLISLLALLVSSVLVGLIVKKLTGGWGAAVFAAALCLGLFGSQVPGYVGMDDPQMLAHPFFLFGLWLYLGAPPSTLRVAGITSLFVLGGNIKQSLLPAPISALSDLFTTCSSKAVRFMVFGAFFLALSIVVNILVGGPFFISHLMTSRVYSFLKVRTMFLSFYLPLGLPLAISAFWSVRQLQNRQARVISFYFFSSLLVGAAFGGGVGVNANVYLDNLFAMSIIMGACLDLLWKAPIPSLGKGGRWRFLVPVLLYSGVFLTFGRWGFEVPKYLSAFPKLQKQFEAEVSFLAAQPGPAICESLIRCYDAGKPYSLDPFNSTSLIQIGKLNSNDLVKQIAEKKYAAIQTDTPLKERPNERFPDEVLDAIDRYYVEAVKDPDCFIYVPRKPPENDQSRP